MPRHLTRSAIIALAAIPILASAQQPAAQRNAFAGFETIVLPNGLKVWFKRLPGDPTVSVSVAVPAGLDQDPPGLEHLSHFTEHMMFSGQPGHTESEVKREVDERGGVTNASTTTDHTFYFVRIGKAHGQFAIDWMFRLVSPHAMDSAVVDRQREPVALEVRARPRQVFDWLQARYVNPPLLRMPDFWAREFGLETAEARDVDLWRSVHRIAPADLRWFYDRYYVPSRMTLTIAGDLDRDSTMARIDATFAAWPARAARMDSVTLHDAGRRRVEYDWQFRPNVWLDLRYRLTHLTARDRVISIFLARWLDKRLNDRLRFGERKASYGLAVGTMRRGPASYLYVIGGIKPSEYAYARRVVDDEFDSLRAGTRSDSAFLADRDAVASKLRAQDGSAKDLEKWVLSDFHDGVTFRDYPDLVAAFEAMPKHDVEAFVRQRLTPTAQVVAVTYPMPLSQGLLAALGVLLVWIGIRAARRALLRPLDMTRLRYVSRFRVPGIYWVTVVPVCVAVAAVVFRLVLQAVLLLTDRFAVQIDNFWGQWAIYAALAALVVVLIIAMLSRVPRKILCFEDCVVIKYLAYRSVRIDTRDVADVALRRFADVWLTRRVWSCLPLALGIMRPAIHLRRSDGRSYYFHVRDDAECMGMLPAAGSVTKRE